MKKSTLRTAPSSGSSPLYSGGLGWIEALGHLPQDGGAVKKPAGAAPRVGIFSDLFNEEEEPFGKSLIRACSHGARLAGGIPCVIDLPRWPEGAFGSLFVRELTVDTIELLCEEHSLQAAVFLPESAFSSAAMLLGQLRADLPSAMLPCAPVPRNVLEAALLAIPEALGLALFGSSWSGRTPGKISQAYQAGRRVVELAVSHLFARRMAGLVSLKNGIRMDAVLGGTVEGTLLILAAAQETGMALTLSQIDEVARNTPSAQWPAFSAEGGSADLCGGEELSLAFYLLRKELEDAPTVTGPRISNLVASIRRPSATFVKPGARQGIVALSGNLASQGALVSLAQVSERVFQFSGPARIFSSEAEALAALKDKSIRRGDVLVVRGAGPKGGPGAPPLLKIAAAALQAGLAKEAVLLTDGRVPHPSGLLAVQCMAPEAVAGGALGVLREGETVSVDIPARSVSVRVTDMELKLRMTKFQPAAKPARSGFFSRFAKAAGSLASGARLS